MTIDMDKMKQRKGNLQNRGGTNGGNANFWRPQDGEQTIRILPTPDGDPFKDYWFHYNVGNKPGFLSPKKNFGEDDPLDSFVRKLFGEGTEESRKLAKDLMAKQRFFSPVIVRGEEDRGVQVWGYSKTVYETLLNLVLNPEYGDITDPESGTDLVIVYGKPAGASFPQTKITPRRRSTQLFDEMDDDQCASTLESIPDMDNLFERKGPEEVGSMLDEFLSGDDGAEQRSTETEKYGTADKATTSDTVDQAFQELLGS